MSAATGAAAGQSIRLEGIDKSYGTTAVLRGFDLTIPAGTFCTLLGASGSGKTTLLKMIAGFEQPDAGTIRIGERDVGGVPPARRNIGMVFQNYALFPHMRVRANVAFGLDMRRTPRAEAARRVEEALATVGLERFGDRYPRELSGGQQQRVALARAVVIRPDILLMDEPLGALDRNLRQALQLELKQLQSRLGVTVAFVTHDQDEAMHLSDMVVLLREGRIEQVGTPQELYLRPASEYVATFLGECNHIVQDGRRYGLRPEKLRLRASAPTAAPIAVPVPERELAARVTHLTFLGAGLRAGLECEGGDLVALLPFDAETSKLRTGQAARFCYAEHDLMPYG